MARKMEDILAMKRIQSQMEEEKEEVSKKIENRYAANKKIVEVLSKYFEANKDIRFHQGLQILFGEPSDKFNEESLDTLFKLLDRIS